ncbi:MAG: diacylglycerol/lipid kinase family protein [Egibacteraceae bacterium]
MTRAVLLVANAQAGTAEDEAIDAARAALAERAEVEVARPAEPAELERVLSRLGERMLVVAGGDGSIHVVVRTLLRHDPSRLAGTAIGLIPLGTGNDLASGLGIPTDPVEAARVCLAGTVRRLDLFTTDQGEVVVNAAHAGLGAAAAERSEGMKASLGALSYPLGAMIAGVREAGWDLVVTVDEARVHDGKTLMVGIANAPCIGGGARLCMRAKPDDGLLDVVVVSAVGPAARIAFGVALRGATHLDRDDVLHLRGRAVTIAGERVAHDLDGELVGELESCTYTVRPGAWRLVAPTPPESARLEQSPAPA